MEAHFVERNEDGKIIEGWPIGQSFEYPQHKTTDDRIQMADMFTKKYQWPIPTYVDSIDNDFNNKYAAWPDRAYLIYDKRLIYVARVNNNGTRNDYWTTEIEKLLDSN